MASVLIIGASKGIGLETTHQLLAAGHQVRAFSRSVAESEMSHPRLEKIRGDALNRHNIDAALEGMDVVIQVLGLSSLLDLFRPVSLFSNATRVLVKAMEAKPVKRLICITGFVAGDSQASISYLQRRPFQILFGRAYADKSLQEQLIKDSSLEWTIARPGFLTNGRRTGRYKILDRASEWRNGMISRLNVADFLVRQVEDRTHLEKTPVLVC
ncbi:MAG: SDR family oxidoreductase [Betaproteobacteria bacterium]|nr:SDR family oxidoreductase [Betaproteobacteria bacterium]MBM3623078.1 SDR family oxidoreductase [Alphaproteobacteria bacterium]